MSDWIDVSSILPPQGEFVLTKIDDGNVRNECQLRRLNGLYFLHDGTYVYYTPTHWQPLPPKPKS